jgi:hypothetical protein
MQVWRRYYLRHNPDAHPHPLAGSPWDDDFGYPDVQATNTTANKAM